MSSKLSATYRIQTHKILIALEPVFRKSRGEARASIRNLRGRHDRISRLGMVLEACPDIVDYAKGGISNWRDFRRRRDGRAADARHQPQRLGGGASGDGRNTRRDRRRGHIAKGDGGHQRRRLSARTHSKGRGEANSRSGRC